jgi:Holliday junction resolvase RusA-like endonuclease
METLPTEERSPFVLARTSILRTTTVCHVTLHGEPYTKNSRPGDVHCASRQVQWLRERLRHAMEEHYPDFVTNRTHDLGVSIALYAKTRQRRDIDNMIKLVFDACTTIIWGDDLQVIELISHVYRRHRTPRTNLIVYTLGGSYQKYCETCQILIISTHKILTKSRNARFCSKECYDIAQRKGQYVHCATCTKRLYRQNDTRQQKRFFCSPECRSLAMTAQRICRYCQQPFYQPGARTNLCSDVCREAWHAKKRSPSQRPGKCPTCGVPSGQRYGRSQQCQSCYWQARRAKYA